VSQSLGDLFFLLLPVIANQRKYDSESQYRASERRYYARRSLRKIKNDKSANQG
jgi:hypothetical protein